MIHLVVLKVVIVSIFLSLASSYDPSRVQCPWTNDGKILMVYNGIECVEPIPQQRLTTTKAYFACPKQEGYYPFPQNESMYYYCQDGIPSLETCPTSTVFDGKDVCVDRKSEEHKSFKCPKSKGKFRVTRSVSNQYYQCFRNRPQLRSCPQYQHFNGRHCVDSRARQQRQEFQCPADNGVYYDQRDGCCFWVCRNRVPTKGRCPPRECGCVNTWRKVSGVIIHQDNGHRIIDTWNTNTQQWDRTYNSVYGGQVLRQEGQNYYYQPRFVTKSHNRNSQQRILGYPVDDARVLAERMLDENYRYK